MAKIYVASSWRNAYQPVVVKKLREQGYEVYDFRNPPKKKGFAWSDIDPDWLNWSTDQYREALKHPIAKAGFESDFNAMQEADVCVLVLPCGRSANAEAGWMKGAGKKVYVLQKQHEEPELMYMMFDGVFGSEEEILSELAESEDENIRKEIVDFICWEADRGSITTEQREKSNSWLAWLEKQGEQKPVEWSEEDEKRIEQICEDLQCGMENRNANKLVRCLHYDEIIISNIDWLKSLRSQKHWKPSLQQINALSVVIKHGQTDDIEALKELYEQLKKLRGNSYE